MSDKILQYVELINNGEMDELLPYFNNNIGPLINLISKKGLLHLIDPFSDELSIKEKNKIVFTILDSDNEEVRNKLFKHYINLLGDVDEINGNYYLNISDLKDLSELFKYWSRDVCPRDIAEKVLSEDYWDAFWDTTDNVYRDVIESLTPDNLKYFKQLVLKELNGKEIELDSRSSDLMEELVEKQNKETSFNVTEENIDEILRDEDTTLWLLKNELEEINSELYNIHSNAYNSAYNDEYYRKVWDNLNIYFEGNPDWFKWGKGNRVRLKIKEDKLFELIYNFFYEYQNYGDDFEYYGSFMSLLYNLMDNSNKYDFLNFRIIDYPSFREVENNINEYFKEYL